MLACHVQEDCPEDWIKATELARQKGQFVATSLWEKWPMAFKKELYFSRGRQVSSPNHLLEIVLTGCGHYRFVLGRF